MEKNTDDVLHDPVEGKREIHRRKWPWILFALGLFALAAALILMKGLGRAPAVPNGESGMFEWDENSIQHIDQALELADRLGITRWYQEIDFSDGENQELPGFIEAMTGVDVEVYALVGAKEWGLEEDGASLIGYMENVQKYNETVSPEQKIKGIMADVEPYVLKTFKEDKQTHMKAYVSGMVKCREWAEDHGLTLIACIPRHYDDQGLSEQLETLIAQGCHEVAVMDYDCGNEVEKIETEALLAVKYKKPLHCILEFQEVGKHGLPEEKTYRNKGLEAAREAWNQVEAAFQDARMIRDYHWTAPIWDMLEQEEDESRIKDADGAVVKEQPKTVMQGGSDAATAAEITVEQAKEIALEDAGASASDATFTEAKLDYDDGISVYDIEFYASGQKYDYEINASTGAVKSKKIETMETAAQQGGNNAGDIGMEKAKSIALTHAGVSDVMHTKAELDRENGQLVYEIAFYGDGVEYEYTIRADDGAIIEYDMEWDD